MPPISRNSTFPRLRLSIRKLLSLLALACTISAVAAQTADQTLDTWVSALSANLQSAGYLFAANGPNPIITDAPASAAAAAVTKTNQIVQTLLHFDNLATLSPLAAGTTDSRVVGVSSKDTVGGYRVVGQGDMAPPVLYTANWGEYQLSPAALTPSIPWVQLSGLPGGNVRGDFTGISIDGSTGIGGVIVGSSNQPFVNRNWSNVAPILLPVPSGYPGGYATAISANGTIVAGGLVDSSSSFGLINYESGYWTYAPGSGTYGFTLLGKFPGSVSTETLGVSANGGTIVGQFIDSSGFAHSFAWTTATEFVDLAAGLSGGAAYGAAFAATADGTVIVGTVNNGSYAYHWTQSAGIEVFPTLTGLPYSVAQCVSSDGAFIGGRNAASGNSISPVAVIWTSSGKVYNLQGLLTVLGANLSGWVLNEVQSIVKNSDGSYVFAGYGSYNGAFSQGFLFQLSFAPNSLVITVPLANQTVVAGSNAVFAIEAAGSATPFTYQWRLNGSSLSGATNATLTVATAQVANVGSYTVAVTDANGITIFSPPATLAINTTPTAPDFATQPSSVTIASGATVVFSTAATGSPSPTYQWLLNGTPLAGATGPRLVISGTATVNPGAYVCLATNSGGSTTSNPALLSTLATTNGGRLGNLSVLTGTGSGPQPFTVGFITGGAGTNGMQPLLIRGDGPLLAAAPFNLAGTLSNPVISLFASGASTPLATNANWGANQAVITTAEANTFAYPLAPGSLDAAIVSSLAPGAYSVQVTSNSGGSGTALAEVFDDTDTFGLSSPRLVNLSCLAPVGANALLTAGFVVGGATAKTVLIRVSGPALAVGPFNLTGVMLDPELTVHTSVNGQDTILASNSSWGGDAQITAAANSVFAFPWANPGSKDSAALVTLAPGSYTAQVASASGVAGTVLVEVYDVP